jgi:hypothetical protein
MPLNGDRKAGAMKVVAVNEAPHGALEVTFMDVDVPVEKTVDTVEKDAHVEDLDAALEDALNQKNTHEENWSPIKQLPVEEEADGGEDHEGEENDAEDVSEEEESSEEMDDKDDEFVPERRSSRKPSKARKVGYFHTRV